MSDNSFIDPKAHKQIPVSYLSKKKKEKTGKCFGKYKKTLQVKFRSTEFARRDSILSKAQGLES